MCKSFTFVDDNSMVTPKALIEIVPQLVEKCFYTMYKIFQHILVFVDPKSLIAIVPQLVEKSFTLSKVVFLIVWHSCDNH